MIFNVTTEEANVLIAGLAELPFKVTAGLITKLQQQAAPQLAEEAAVTEASPVATPDAANSESVQTQGE